MKIFHILYVTFAQAFYRWAMREIDPLHDDVPKIVQRQRELEDQARRMFSGVGRFGGGRFGK